MEASTDIDMAIRTVKAKLPPEVAALRYESGHDAGDEPALWVWVVFHQASFDSAWTRENRDSIRDTIVHGLRDAGVPFWTYVRFRSSDEEAELAKAEGRGA